MKEILVLGDVHANYPALKAIGDYLQMDRFNRIINTGDLTVYSTFPNESIQWFRNLGDKAICILGNTDKRILKILKGKKLKKPKKKDKQVMYFWTSENLSQENIAYLKSLSKKSDFNIDGLRIGLFHGSLDDPNAQLFPSTPDSRFIKLAKNSPYGVHIMGHSHVPFYKVIAGVHFINPGSVGRMFDGDPRASFAILKVSSRKIGVEHFRIPYPVTDVIKGLKKYKLPDIYCRMFQAGKKLN
ncbi:MAG: metallophosphoesterase [Deltaproteobacteria bacterium]|nr:MAG: metallophosphoesterase [Deltaproteobacteria bacterium]